MKGHTDWHITDNAIDNCVAIEDEQGPFAYVECEIQELAHQIIVGHECCAGADSPLPGELATLRAENARLREALKPFAKFADYYDLKAPLRLTDDEDSFFTVHDCRLCETDTRRHVIHRSVGRSAL